MKKKLNTEYITFNDPRCPYCGSHDYNYPDFEYLEGQDCRLDFSCRDCEEEWQEIFTKVAVYNEWWYLDTTDEVIVDRYAGFPKEGTD